ncbi:MAG: response regulator transcription factor [Solirubrobacteraceae bacterium]
MTDAPVSLPVDQGFGLTFPTPEVASAPAGFAADAGRARLTARETRVAELLAEGRSNREIAASLVLSPETVKSHVSSILRKLDASNRAEAVSRLARMSVQYWHAGPRTRPPVTTPRLRVRWRRPPARSVPPEAAAAPRCS